MMLLRRIPLWLIPIVYALISFAGALMLPRFELAYFQFYVSGLSVASAQAFFAAVASGMIALTGIVFSVGLVMVQFSAMAYSPRLVLLFARDPMLFHSLGVFIATFLYSLGALAWVDREGTKIVPVFSVFAVGGLLLLSMLLFSRLIKGLSDLQITNVLHMLGDGGRRIIRETFQGLDKKADGRATVGREADPELGPAVQTLTYVGAPRTIAELDIDELVRQGQRAGAVIVMACGVGDTLVNNTRLLQVHGAKAALPERGLMRSIHLALERTADQDPKYPIRLLVDVAIKALSPAINDPTTAVQAIDQIEDLLRRLGQHELDAGYARDANGVLRLVFPMPTWEDYLTLAFDEIRLYGANSVQVMRRLRSALLGVADTVVTEERADAVRRYLKQLDVTIVRSIPDAMDQEMARQEDRQGLGLSRRHSETKKPSP
jgi:uncharacterized membrane protein